MTAMATVTSRRRGRGGQIVQEELFGVTPDAIPAAPVLMSLNPAYYELIWQGKKRHEFRRRYLAGRPTRWHVYLTAPVSRLVAVIELDEAIIDTPERIASLAEQARVGNGASVFDYLKDRPRGFALPIRQVREYHGFSAGELADTLGGFHPPQGYTLVGGNPALVAVCDKLTSTGMTRELTVRHP
jgi:predicted transcriptional regulator